MAINKNFVIKNGFEVRTNLIVGDANTGKVGIGTTTPNYTLHVNGGIGATDLKVSGFSTLGATSATGLSVSGFSTHGATSATLLNVSGVTTISGGFSASQGADLARLRVTGITTLGDATTSTLSVTGFSTLGSISVGNVILAGITTGLNVPGIATLTSLVGTSANFSGISTLTSLSGTNINYTGVGTITNTTGTNLNFSGIATVGSLSIGSTQVISSARQLQNIASLDATTTTTIESAIANAPNSFTDLKVTGISTLGQTTAEGLSVTGFSTLGATSATLLNVSGVTTVSGGLNVSQGGDFARLRVTGITTLGDATASTLSVTGFSTHGATSATLLNVSGVSTLGTLQISSGIVTASSGIITYFGDGSKLSNITSGVGIQSGGIVVGYGFTTLNFVGSGNTFAISGTRVDISISGGGGGGNTGFATYNAGIATASSVGIHTSNLDDPDLTGIGNSFQGLYIGNGMLIVDNALNGNHYIGTNFNGLMAGPVTINGTLTIDGNYIVV